MNGDNNNFEEEEVIYPIDGVLDLHSFHPAEVKAVVLEYIDTCRENGVYDLRIIHGKGKGVLRQQVMALLERHEHVLRFSPGGDGGGGWGATVVRLKS